MLCKWGKPWVVLTIQEPLDTGLLVGCGASCVLWLGALVRLKVVFGDEWSYKLDFLTGHSGRRRSNTSKALCCLNSSRTASQVPWLKRAASFGLQSISSARPPLGCSAVVLQSFQEFLLALLVRWPGRLSTMCGPMSQLPCLGGRAGAGSDPQLCLWINHSAHVKQGKPQCVVLTLLWSDYTCSAASWLECYGVTQLSGIFSSPSGLMGQEDAPQCVWMGVWLNSLPGSG